MAWYSKLLACLLSLFVSGLAFAEGDSYEDGDAAFVRRDYKTAHRILKPLAEAGDARAQTQFGILLFRREAPYLDPEEGIQWLLKAAAQGEVRAYRNLGMLLRGGTPDGKIKPNLEEAFMWSLKAAEAGDVYSQRHTGHNYVNGRGVRSDTTQAVYWFRKAAEQGDANAQYWLAHAYLEGQGGVQRSSLDAAIWLERAAAGGERQAMKEILELYVSDRSIPLAVRQQRGACWAQTQTRGRSPKECASLPW